MLVACSGRQVAASASQAHTGLPACTAFLLPCSCSRGQTGMSPAASLDEKLQRVAGAQQRVHVACRKGGAGWCGLILQPRPGMAVPCLAAQGTSRHKARPFNQPLPPSSLPPSPVHAAPTHPPTHPPARTALYRLASGLPQLVRRMKKAPQARSRRPTRGSDRLAPAAMWGQGSPLANKT